MHSRTSPRSAERVDFYLNGLAVEFRVRNVGVNPFFFWTHGDWVYIPLMPARQRKSTDEDASTRAMRAVEAVTGLGPIEDAAEAIADPELRKQYREAMAKEKASKLKAQNP